MRPAVPRLAVFGALALPLAFAALVPSSVAATESVAVLHERALHLYEEGEYEQAVSALNEVLAAGVDDPVVHYNLANSWFKAGRLGFSIYHYRRALALAPRDEDVRANLEYARFLALDSIDAQARTDTKVDGWLDRITTDEVLLLPGLLWMLAGVSAVIWQLTGAPGSRWKRVAGTFATLWAASIVLAVVVDRRATRLDEAVVLSHETTVRNGPGDSFDTAFLLHEGAECVVEGERGSWTEISLPGELRGWIPTDQIARL